MLRPPPLENNLVRPTRCLGAVGVGAHGPGQDRPPQHVAREERGQGREIGDRIGEELRAGSRKISEVIRPAPPARGKSLARPPPYLLRHEPARNPGRGLAHRRHLERIERHQRRRPLIAGEHLRGAPGQPGVAIAQALEFDRQGRAPRDQIEQLAQRNDPVGRVLERYAFEFRGGHRRKRAAAFGQPPERRVMVHHRLAVGGDLQVGFDRVARGDRGREGARRVLDRAFSVQPAMRDRPRGQPIEAAHDTSNEPSTSTAALSGSAATPTVVRACRPLSPNAVTIRSEAPFITLGPSGNRAAELMKPPSRTTRTTLSRSPSAALIWHKRLMAQARAAFWPSSIETSAPSWPCATSLPSASKHSWPDTTMKFAVRTNGT